MTGELSVEAARYFRDRIREARAAALKDAEAFLGIVVAIEGLGRFLQGNRAGEFGKLRPQIGHLVQQAPLARATEATERRIHTPFAAAYELVRQGRNSAVHEGAYARHLTAKSVELALIVEDALTVKMNHIGDFMVQGVLTASPWQPLSFIRQTMLSNSFSYLPVWMKTAGRDGWWLISDYELASYLRTDNGASRQERLAATLDAAVAAGELRLDVPHVCSPEQPVTKALAAGTGLPVLICGAREQDLIGIATPYDLL